LLENIQSELDETAIRVRETSIGLEALTNRCSDSEKEITGQLKDIATANQNNNVTLNEAINTRFEMLSQRLTLIENSVFEIDRTLKEGKICEYKSSTTKPKKENIMGKKMRKWILAISGIGFVLILLTTIIFFQPDRLKWDIGKIDDQFLTLNANVIDSQVDSFVAKITSNNSNSDNIKEEAKNLKAALKSRLEIIEGVDIKELTREKNLLIKNVLIINLIGRFTVIICCIVAFAFILKAFAGAREKDDVFE
jgi:hypothetical protein